MQRNEHLFENVGVGTAENWPRKGRKICTISKVPMLHRSAKNRRLRTLSAGGAAQQGWPLRSLSVSRF